MGLATKLNLFCTYSGQAVFRLSPDKSHDVPEAIKLIRFIYCKKNNYLLMDRAYKDDKTFAQTHSFRIVVPSTKKIVNPIGSTMDSFTNNAIISNDISLN